MFTVTLSPNNNPLVVQMNYKRFISYFPESIISQAIQLDTSKAETSHAQFHPTTNIDLSHPDVTMEALTYLHVFVEECGDLTPSHFENKDTNQKLLAAGRYLNVDLFSVLADPKFIHFYQHHYPLILVKPDRLRLTYDVLMTLCLTHDFVALAQYIGKRVPSQLKDPDYLLNAIVTKKREMVAVLLPRVDIMTVWSLSDDDLKELTPDDRSEQINNVLYGEYIEDDQRVELISHISDINIGHFPVIAAYFYDPVIFAMIIHDPRVTEDPDGLMFKLVTEPGPPYRMEVISLLLNKFRYQRKELEPVIEKTTHWFQSDSDTKPLLLAIVAKYPEVTEYIRKLFPNGRMNEFDHP